MCGSAGEDSSRPLSQINVSARVHGLGHRHADEDTRGLEATVGIEPTMKVLQTSALPLGYVAAVFTMRIVAPMPQLTGG